MNNVNFSAGIFFILGICSVAFLSLQVSNLIGNSFADGYSVEAYFDNVGGLKPRAAVRSSGVLVGRVDTIEFDDFRYQAKVVLNLKKGTKFPKDSSAKILTAGLLGENYVGLSPGAEGEFLTAGDRLEMTQSAVILENVISQFLYNAKPE